MTDATRERSARAGSDRPRFGFLSTYPPTRCGLATFTAALASAMADGGTGVSHVVRVDDLVPTGPPVLGPHTTVTADLRPGDPESIAAAIRSLNADDVAIVQHEFGIYGGPDGDEVIQVLEGLLVPAIVVLHTVLDTPTDHQREVLDRVGQLADVVVVMSDTARQILARRSTIPAAKVKIIPHGVEPWTRLAAVTAADRPVVLTWGLIGPGKGIEWGIRAIAQLDPRPLYRVVGETHPKVILHSGESYRESLIALARELGVENDVQFDARYLGTADLAAVVRTADVVLLPYDSVDQVTSGVLVEAVAAGKPVIATRFPHAVELLSSGAGTIVTQKRPDEMADALHTVLEHHDLAASMAATALQESLHTSWSAVAAEYRALSSELLLRAHAA